MSEPGAEQMRSELLAALNGPVWQLAHQLSTQAAEQGDRHVSTAPAEVLARVTELVAAWPHIGGLLSGSPPAELVNAPYAAGVHAERERIRRAIENEYGPGSEGRRMRRVLLGDER